jgi:cytochrome c oxidase subunit 2
MSSKMFSDIFEQIIYLSLCLLILFLLLLLEQLSRPMFFIYCDAASSYQMTIQDPATTLLEWMTSFYDLLFLDILIIICIIFELLLALIINSSHHTNAKRHFSHSTELEVFWTIIPALILLTIAYPSFNLLYALDDLTDPAITVKIVGHQWYWSYEYNILNTQVAFDSYILNTSDLVIGMFRLLEVDNRVVLPTRTHIRLLITSADVLHSWAVPSFGIKVDACPGRLNQASLFIKRPGLFFGQCSEICGVNHGFMPIVICATSKEVFLTQN